MMLTKEGVANGLWEMKVHIIEDRLLHISSS
jgi:hypothetical protein